MIQLYCVKIFPVQAEVALESCRELVEKVFPWRENRGTSPLRLWQWASETALLCMEFERRGIVDEPVTNRGAYGKPALAGEEFHFNFSHSAEHLIMASADVSVGCDIEINRHGYKNLAIKYLHPNELKIFNDIETDAAQEQMFLRLWTRKEAIAKCLGLGISLGFKDIDVSGALESASAIHIHQENIIVSEIFLNNESIASYALLEKEGVAPQVQIHNIPMSEIVDLIIKKGTGENRQPL